MKSSDGKTQADMKEKLRAAAAAQAHAVGDAALHGATMARDAAAAHARLVMSDLWSALKTDWRMQVLMAILLISLVIWNAPFSHTVLFPFKTFVTIIHEACHAMAARFTGGNISKIGLNETAGGTYTLGGFEPLIVFAGYFGASLFGALLIWWGRKPEIARSVLQTTGIVFMVLTIFYAELNLYTFLSMFGIGAVLFLVSWKASERVCHMLLLVLAIQTTLQAFLQIEYLFYFQQNSMGIMSDALHMEKVTGVPSLVWTLLWAVISLLLFTYSFWISYRPAKPAQAVIPNGVVAEAPAESPAVSPETAPTEGSAGNEPNEAIGTN